MDAFATFSEFLDQAPSFEDHILNKLTSIYDPIRCDLERLHLSPNEHKTTFHRVMEWIRALQPQNLVDNRIDPLFDFVVHFPLCPVFEEFSKDIIVLVLNMGCSSLVRQEITPELKLKLVKLLLIVHTRYTVHRFTEATVQTLSVSEKMFNSSLLEIFYRLFASTLQEITYSECSPDIFLFVLQVTVTFSELDGNVHKSALAFFVNTFLTEDVQNLIVKTFNDRSNNDNSDYLEKLFQLAFHVYLMLFKFQNDIDNPLVLNHLRTIKMFVREYLPIWHLSLNTETLTKLSLLIDLSGISLDDFLLNTHYPTRQDSPLATNSQVRSMLVELTHTANQFTNLEGTFAKRLAHIMYLCSLIESPCFVIEEVIGFQYWLFSREVPTKAGPFEVLVEMAIALGKEHYQSLLFVISRLFHVFESRITMLNDLMFQMSSEFVNENDRISTIPLTDHFASYFPYEVLEQCDIRPPTKEECAKYKDLAPKYLILSNATMNVLFRKFFYWMYWVTMSLRMFVDIIKKNIIDGLEAKKHSNISPFQNAEFSNLYAKSSFSIVYSLMQITLKHSYLFSSTLNSIPRAKVAPSRAARYFIEIVSAFARCDSDSTHALIRRLFDENHDKILLFPNFFRVIFQYIMSAQQQQQSEKSLQIPLGGVLDPPAILLNVRRFVLNYYAQILFQLTAMSHHPYGYIHNNRTVEIDNDFVSTHDIITATEPDFFVFDCDPAFETLKKHKSLIYYLKVSNLNSIGQYRHGYNFPLFETMLDNFLTGVLYLFVGSYTLRGFTKQLFEEMEAILLSLVAALKKTKHVTTLIGFFQTFVNCALSQSKVSKTNANALRRIEHIIYFLWQTILDLMQVDSLKIKNDAALLGLTTIEVIPTQILAFCKSLHPIFVHSLSTFSILKNNGRVIVTVTHAFSKTIDILSRLVQLEKEWVNAGQEARKRLDELNHVQDELVDATEFEHEILLPLMKCASLARYSDSTLDHLGAYVTVFDNVFDKSSLLNMAHKAEAIITSIIRWNKVRLMRPEVPFESTDRQIPLCDPFKLHPLKPYFTLLKDLIHNSPVEEVVMFNEHPFEFFKVVRSGLAGLSQFDSSSNTSYDDIYSTMVFMIDLVRTKMEDVISSIVEFKQQPSLNRKKLTEDNSVYHMMLSIFMCTAALFELQVSFPPSHEKTIIIKKIAEVEGIIVDHIVEQELNPIDLLNAFILTQHIGSILIRRKCSYVLDRIFSEWNNRCEEKGLFLADNDYFSTNWLYHTTSHLASFSHAERQATEIYLALLMSYLVEVNDNGSIRVLYETQLCSAFLESNEVIGHFIVRSIRLNQLPYVALSQSMCHKLFLDFSYIILNSGDEDKHYATIKWLVKFLSDYNMAIRDLAFFVLHFLTLDVDVMSPWDGMLNFKHHYYTQCWQPLAIDMFRRELNSTFNEKPLGGTFDFKGTWTEHENTRFMRALLERQKYCCSVDEIGIVSNVREMFLPNNVFLDPRCDFEKNQILFMAKPIEKQELLTLDTLLSAISSCNLKIQPDLDYTVIPLLSRIFSLLRFYFKRPDIEKDPSILWEALDANDSILNIISVIEPYIATVLSRRYFDIQDNTLRGSINPLHFRFSQAAIESERMYVLNGFLSEKTKDTYVLVEMLELLRQIIKLCADFNYRLGSKKNIDLSHLKTVENKFSKHFATIVCLCYVSGNVVVSTKARMLALELSRVGPCSNRYYWSENESVMQIVAPLIVFNGADTFKEMSTAYCKLLMQLSFSFPITFQKRLLTTGIQPNAIFQQLVDPPVINTLFILLTIINSAVSPSELSRSLWDAIMELLFPHPKFDTLLATTLVYPKALMRLFNELGPATVSMAGGLTILCEKQIDFAITKFFHELLHSAGECFNNILKFPSFINFCLQLKTRGRMALTKILMEKSKKGTFEYPINNRSRAVEITQTLVSQIPYAFTGYFTQEDFRELPLNRPALLNNLKRSLQIELVNMEENYFEMLQSVNPSIPQQSAMVLPITNTISSTLMSSLLFCTQVTDTLMSFSSSIFQIKKLISDAMEGSQAYIGFFDMLFDTIVMCLATTDYHPGTNRISFKSLTHSKIIQRLLPQMPGIVLYRFFIWLLEQLKLPYIPNNTNDDSPRVKVEERFVVSQSMCSLLSNCSTNSFHRYRLQLIHCALIPVLHHIVRRCILRIQHNNDPESYTPFNKYHKQTERHYWNYMLHEMFPFEYEQIINETMPLVTSVVANCISHNDFPEDVGRALVYGTWQFFDHILYFMCDLFELKRKNDSNVEFEHISWLNDVEQFITEAHSYVSSNHLLQTGTFNDYYFTSLMYVLKMHCLVSEDALVKHDRSAQFDMYIISALKEDPGIYGDYVNVGLVKLLEIGTRCRNSTYDEHVSFINRIFTNRIVFLTRVRQVLNRISTEFRKVYRLFTILFYLRKGLLHDFIPSIYHDLNSTENLSSNEKANLNQLLLEKVGDIYQHVSSRSVTSHLFNLLNISNSCVSRDDQFLFRSIKLGCLLIYISRLGLELHNEQANSEFNEKRLKFLFSATSSNLNNLLVSFKQPHMQQNPRSLEILNVTCESIVLLYQNWRTNVLENEQTRTLFFQIGGAELEIRDSYKHTTGQLVDKRIGLLKHMILQCPEFLNVIAPTFAPHAAKAVACVSSWECKPKTDPAPKEVCNFLLWIRSRGLMTEQVANNFLNAFIARALELKRAINNRYKRSEDILLLFAAMSIINLKCIMICLSCISFLSVDQSERLLDIAVNVLGYRKESLTPLMSNIEQAFAPGNNTGFLQYKAMIDNVKSPIIIEFFRSMHPHFEAFVWHSIRYAFMLLSRLSITLTIDKFTPRSNNIVRGKGMKSVKRPPRASAATATEYTIASMALRVYSFVMKDLLSQFKVGVTSVYYRLYLSFIIRDVVYGMFSQHEFAETVQLAFQAAVFETRSDHQAHMSHCPLFNSSDILDIDSTYSFFDNGNRDYDPYDVFYSRLKIDREKLTYTLFSPLWMRFHLLLARLLAVYETDIQSFKTVNNQVTSLAPLWSVLVSYFWTYIFHINSSDFWEVLIECGAAAISSELALRFAYLQLCVNAKGASLANDIRNVWSYILSGIITSKRCDASITQAFASHLRLVTTLLLSSEENNPGEHISQRLFPFTTSLHTWGKILEKHYKMMYNPSDSMVSTSYGDIHLFSAYSNTFAESLIVMNDTDLMSEYFKMSFKSSWSFLLTEADSLVHVPADNLRPGFYTPKQVLMQLETCFMHNDNIEPIAFVSNFGLQTVPQLLFEAVSELLTMRVIEDADMLPKLNLKLLGHIASTYQYPLTVVKLLKERYVLSPERIEELTAPTIGIALNILFENGDSFLARHFLVEFLKKDSKPTTITSQLINNLELLGVYEIQGLTRQCCDIAFDCVLIAQNESRPMVFKFLLDDCIRLMKLCGDFKSIRLLSEKLMISQVTHTDAHIVFPCPKSIDPIVTMEAFALSTDWNNDSFCQIFNGYISSMYPAVQMQRTNAQKKKPVHVKAEDAQLIGRVLSDHDRLMRFLKITLLSKDGLLGENTLHALGLGTLAQDYVSVLYQRHMSNKFVSLDKILKGLVRFEFTSAVGVQGLVPARLHMSLFRNVPNDELMMRFYAEQRVFESLPHLEDTIFNQRYLAHVSTVSQIVRQLKNRKCYDISLALLEEHFRNIPPIMYEVDAGQLYLGTTLREYILLLLHDQNPNTMLHALKYLDEQCVLWIERCDNPQLTSMMYSLRGRVLSNLYDRLMRLKSKSRFDSKLEETILRLNRYFESITNAPIETNMIEYVLEKANVYLSSSIRTMPNNNSTPAGTPSYWKNYSIHCRRVLYSFKTINAEFYKWMKHYIITQLVASLFDAQGATVLSRSNVLTNVFYLLCLHHEELSKDERFMKRVQRLSTEKLLFSWIIWNLDFFLRLFIFGPNYDTDTDAWETPDWFVLMLKNTLAVNNMLVPMQLRQSKKHLRHLAPIVFFGYMVLCDADDDVVGMSLDDITDHFTKNRERSKVDANALTFVQILSENHSDKVRDIWSLLSKIEDLTLFQEIFQRVQKMADQVATSIQNRESVDIKQYVQGLIADYNHFIETKAVGSNLLDSVVCQSHCQVSSYIRIALVGLDERLSACSNLADVAKILYSLMDILTDSFRTVVPGIVKNSTSTSMFVFELILGKRIRSMSPRAYVTPTKTTLCALTVNGRYTDLAVRYSSYKDYKARRFLDVRALHVVETDVLPLSRSFLHRCSIAENSLILHMPNIHAVISEQLSKIHNLPKSSNKRRLPLETLLNDQISLHIPKQSSIEQTLHMKRNLCVGMIKAYLTSHVMGLPLPRLHEFSVDFERISLRVLSAAGPNALGRSDSLNALPSSLMRFVGKQLFIGLGIPAAIRFVNDVQTFDNLPGREFQVILDDIHKFAFGYYIKKSQAFRHQRVCLISKRLHKLMTDTDDVLSRSKLRKHIHEKVVSLIKTCADQKINSMLPVQLGYYL
ncbi:hypothetical protein PCE1_002025 [Barthelona sp. PCE]